MKTLFIFGILSYFLISTAQAQVNNWVTTEGITSHFHKNNVGLIAFASELKDIQKSNENDFIKAYTSGSKAQLYLCALMSNSLTNYLHTLAPEKTAEELNENGNFQFTFIVDSNVIYTENLNHGAFGLDNKNTRTSFRIPLITENKVDSWGWFMWQRFLANGGDDALADGSHQLKIVLRAYIASPEIKVSDIIAEGEIQFITPIKIQNVKQSLIQIQSIKDKSGWEVSSDSINVELIEQLNLKIAANTFKDITGIVIIKKGKLLLEEYFNNASRKTLHDTRSVSKSFSSCLMGIAITDGHIKSTDQQLNQFYDVKKYANYNPYKEHITIKNLLTMQSAFMGNDMDDSSPGNEEKMYPTSNWVQFVLNLPIDSQKIDQPQWNYFTCGVILLGDIVNKSVPGGMEKYAHDKLFVPLGITKYKWQHTPTKNVNTAGGLQLSALDLAKFGQLYLDKGIYNGIKIFDSSWADESFMHHAMVDNERNENYGYLFWNKTFTVEKKTYESYYCAGNGGSKIYIFPKDDVVIVITAKAYNQMYMHSQVDKMMEKYILPAVLN